jgi:3-dehydroquinate synthase
VRTAIVTDRTVAKHWLEPTERSLTEAGIPASRIIVEEGEASKTYAGLEKVSEALIAARIERNDLVIALGGGVVGDLAGFAAAILRRGVDFVQVPTSLLAQVDSSVGGKTGINSPQGKNLLGAFHQPVLVIADTSVLDTLSPRQFRSGYAEVAKYGVLGDEAFFAWLEANQADIFSGGAAREHAIATSCRAKAAIVSRDERENGERALLNLGHTFGHALEAATGPALPAASPAIEAATASTHIATRGSLVRSAGRMRPPSQVARYQRSPSRAKTLAGVPTPPSAGRVRFDGTKKASTR